MLTHKTMESFTFSLTSRKTPLYYQGGGLWSYAYTGFIWKHSIKHPRFNNRNSYNQWIPGYDVTNEILSTQTISGCRVEGDSASPYPEPYCHVIFVQACLKEKVRGNIKK